uniref:Uncharacterized protein n=1 Tax=Arundo donax TaxID=35708 RepID=A0A0A8Y6Z1_ARUDO
MSLQLGDIASLGYQHQQYYRDSHPASSCR